MRFETIRSVFFRNLADKEVYTGAKDIFLVGENGQGKSNFLELLYFCAYATSFRGQKDAGVVNFSSDACSITAKIANSVLTEQISIKIDKTGKTITIDKKKLEDRKELLSIFPCIIFCHEDMAFISGSPEKRRWFFDQNRSLYDIEYLDLLRKYKKVLKTRNVVIREVQNSNQKTILDVLEPQLVEYGTRIIEKREEETAFFSKVFGPIYQKVSKIEKIEVLYKPSWKMKSSAEIVEYLANTRERDILMGTTLSGPHRDRYLFTQNGRDFVETGSTGQRRLLALLLRIAQATRYREMTGNLPTLLFDDVLLELDGEKRKKILSELPEYEQAFFTFLPEEPYYNYRRQDTLVYFVKNGKFTAEER